MIQMRLIACCTCVRFDPVQRGVSDNFVEQYASYDRAVDGSSSLDSSACCTWTVLSQQLIIMAVEVNAPRFCLHDLSLFSTCRLKEVADKIKKHGHVSAPALQQLRNTIVTQLVLGPNHVALLLEDGRVARVSYNLHQDKLDLAKTDPKT